MQSDRGSCSVRGRTRSARLSARLLVLYSYERLVGYFPSMVEYLGLWVPLKLVTTVEDLTSYLRSYFRPI